MRTPYLGLLGIACCAFVLNCSVQASAQSAAQQAKSRTFDISSQSDRGTANNSDTSLTAARELPDSPGSMLLHLQEASSAGSSESSRTQTQNSAPAQSEAPQGQNSQEQNQSVQKQTEQRPVGTAAAEAPKVSGITAAQPAGVAIAPAKQRRVRTIVLRVGAICAAGAALGAVIALTEATPSKPPGAH